MLSSQPQLAADNRFYFRREFQICYQPIISFTNSRLEGFEALLRWQPERKLLYPTDFMPMLEEVGLICPLGEWLTHETANQLAHWKQQFPFSQPQLSLNLSIKQLESSLLLETLEHLPTAVKFGSKPLQFEIPTQPILANPQHYLPWIKEAHAKGIGICLDDVEPDPAILDLLYQFPIQTLKLTLALTQTIAADPHKQAFLQNFIQTAQTRGVTTVAKGIETEEQYTLMDNLGCQAGQGYLFDHPLQFTEAMTRLRIAERKALRSLKAHLDALYNLNKVMQRWLGHSLIIRYWQATKPTSPWLEPWDPEQHPRMLSSRYADDCISQEQQADLQMWVNRFLHRCNDIVHNLPYLLNQSDLAKTDLQLMNIPKPGSNRTEPRLAPRLIA